ISMVGAPLLYVSIGMPGIFALTGGLALLAIFVVLRVVPAAPSVPRQPTWQSFVEVLSNRQLLRLNFGVFALHLMLTSMWVLLPSQLISTGGLPVGEHWKLYLPALLLSFLIMVPAIIAAERYGRMKLVFNAAVALLLVVQVGFGLFSSGLYWLALWLTLFFVAFNILEATQPSLIARIAPPHAKGAALGVYNTTQALGLFVGGVLGGALAKYVGPSAVWGCGVALTAIWLSLSTTMSMPALRNRQVPA
ncbi:MFS transporter, partial [Accumulibacter sp.]|uniref:MFS transporter n=1 Tax=Accumulibacter sp. TaxID=2053492 RepID=UPI0028C3C42A